MPYLIQPKQWTSDRRFTGRQTLTRCSWESFTGQLEQLWKVLHKSLSSYCTDQEFWHRLAHSDLQTYNTDRQTDRCKMPVSIPLGHFKVRRTRTEPVLTSVSVQNSYVFSTKLEIWWCLKHFVLGGPANMNLLYSSPGETSQETVNNFLSY